MNRFASVSLLAAFALLAAGIGSLALVLYSERGTLFRRLHYPVRQMPA